MRTIKCLMSIAAVLMMAATAQADFTLNQAQNAVNAFNALNNGQGYYYKVSPDNGNWLMSTKSGYDNADFGAYSPLTAGENFAKTFCVEPLVGTGANHYGVLNYENGTTSSSSGDALTLGSAYLYASFAKGELSGYNYESPDYSAGKDLTSAIQYLMGATLGESWGANDYLAGLLDINSDESFWTQVYDPGRYYEEIGDYSVFVMNNKDEYGTKTQNFLYLTAYEPEQPGQGGATPEPATALIFGAGALGLLTLRRIRRRR